MSDELTAVLNRVGPRAAGIWWIVLNVSRGRSSFCMDPTVIRELLADCDELEFEQLLSDLEGVDLVKAEPEHDTVRWQVLRWPPGFRANGGDVEQSFYRGSSN